MRTTQLRDSAKQEELGTRVANINRTKTLNNTDASISRSGQHEERTIISDPGFPKNQNFVVSRHSVTLRQNFCRGFHPVRVNRSTVGAIVAKCASCCSKPTNPIDLKRRGSSKWNGGRMSTAVCLSALLEITEPGVMLMRGWAWATRAINEDLKETCSLFGQM